MKTADEIQNEAIRAWQQGELMQAYRLLRAIPPYLWDSEAAQMTQNELLGLLMEQMKQQYVGTQAEELVKQIIETRELS